MTATALVVAGLTLTFASDLVSPATKKAVSDVALPPLAGFAAVAAARAARRTPDATRRLGWWLLAAAGVCWMLGELAWYQDRYLYRVAADPSWADVFFLAGVLPAAGSLLAFSRSSRRDRPARYLLGALVVGGSVVFVSKALALSVVFPAAGEAPPLARAVYLAYPLSDSVLAALAVIVVLEVQPAWRGSLALIAVGFLGYSVADLWYSYRGALGDYEPGGVSDVGWAVGYLLLGLAALCPDASPPHPAASRSRHEPVQPSSLAVYVPVTVAVVVAALHPSPLDDPVLLVSGGLVLLFFGIREVLEARENARLGRALGARVTQLEHRTEDLRRLAEQTERVVTSVADGVLEVGADGRVRYANPAAAQLLGRLPTSLAGTSERELFRADDARPRGGVSVLAHVLRTGEEVSSVPMTLRRPDGSTLPVVLTAGAVVDQGEVLGVVVVFRDATHGAVGP